MKPSTSQSSPISTPQSHRLILLLLVLLTFAAYLAVGVYYVTGPISPFPGLKVGISGSAYLAVFSGWNGPQEFDDAAYNRAAVEIFRTGIPRDRTGSLFLHAPIYAYFIAGCYWIGGFRLLAIAIPQAILAAFTCVTIALATYRISSRSKLPALVAAGFLFLINLRLAIYVGSVSPTILLLFFFSLAVLAASREFTFASLSIFVAAIILAIGTQAGFFVSALGAAGWLLLRFFQTKGRSLLTAAGIILLFAAGKVLVPVLMGEDSRGSLNEAAEGVLWEANNPYYESMTAISLWERRPFNRWTHWKMSSAEQHRYDEYLERAHHHSAQAAELWIRENPGQYADLVFVRLWTTLGPFTGMMSPRNRLISLCIWLLIFPAGLYGWWLCRAAPISQFAAAVSLMLTLFSALVIVEWYLRYRFPIDLLMTIYAGIGYSHVLMDKFNLRRFAPANVSE